MYAGGSAAEIGAEVELCAKEEDRQEHGNDANSRPPFKHVNGQKEHKEEWLPGQGSWKMRLGILFLLIHAGSGRIYLC
jgi:hypothetical protein